MHDGSGEHPSLCDPILMQNVGPPTDLATSLRRLAFTLCCELDTAESGACLWSQRGLHTVASCKILFVKVNGLCIWSILDI